MSPVSAYPYVFYSADVRTRVPLVREYGELRSRRMYIRYTAIHNDRRPIPPAGGGFSGVSSITVTRQLFSPQRSEYLGIVNKLIYARSASMSRRMGCSKARESGYSVITRTWKAFGRLLYIRMASLVFFHLSFYFVCGFKKDMKASIQQSIP